MMTNVWQLKMMWWYIYIFYTWWHENDNKTKKTVSKNIYWKTLQDIQNLKNTINYHYGYIAINITVMIQQYTYTCTTHSPYSFAMN